MRLRGKTALITGATGTIGAATAKRFLGEGARVVLWDRDTEALAAIADTLEHDDQVLATAADITNEGDVSRAVSEATERFGAIDAFFNNAGVAGPVGPITAIEVEAFDHVMAVNVRGVFLGIKHVAPAMPDVGSIVVTSSVAGLRGSSGIAAYSASKHAVMGLVKSAALELTPRRIRVNAVNPGPVEGPMMRWLEQGQAPADPAKSRAAIRNRMRLGRYIDPQEVADLVIFLASDESQMITGQAHVIDAGLTL